MLFKFRKNKKKYVSAKSLLPLDVIHGEQTIVIVREVISGESETLLETWYIGSESAPCITRIVVPSKTKFEISR